MKKINFKLLIISLIIPLAVGGLAAWIISGSLDLYKDLNLPAFAPPYELFGIVWGVLYVLMGVSLYLVLNSGKSDKEAIWLFALQLFFNFAWPIAFFNFQLFWFSFVWIVILEYLVIKMIIKFVKINKVAGYLQIPYAVWILFASILNLFIAFMN